MQVSKRKKIRPGEKLTNIKGHLSNIITRLSYDPEYRDYTLEDMRKIQDCEHDIDTIMALNPSLEKEDKVIDAINNVIITNPLLESHPAAKEELLQKYKNLKELVQNNKVQVTVMHESDNYITTIDVTKYEEIKPEYLKKGQFYHISLFYKELVKIRQEEEKIKLKEIKLKEEQQKLEEEEKQKQQEEKQKLKEEKKKLKEEEKQQLKEKEIKLKEEQQKLEEEQSKLEKEAAEPRLSREEQFMIARGKAAGAAFTTFAITSILSGMVAGVIYGLDKNPQLLAADLPIIQKFVTSIVADNYKNFILGATAVILSTTLVVGAIALIVESINSKAEQTAAKR